MKFLLTLATLFILNLGSAQNIEYPIMNHSKGELFTSMKYSSKNDLLFVSDEDGKLFAVNSIDSVVATFSFPSGGFVRLDNTGEIGAFCGYDNVVRFFSQETLLLVDSVKLNDTRSAFNFLTWFTKSGIFIGNNEFNYKYDLRTKQLTEVKALTSFRIIDVQYESDLMLVGRWDESMIGYDYKIRTLFLTRPTQLSTKKLIMKSSTFFHPESGAYFMLNGTKVIAKDVKQLFVFDFYTSTLSTPLNDEQVYAMSKLDENRYSIVTPYRGSNHQYLRTILIMDVNSKKIVQAINVKYPPYTSNIVTNYRMSNIYMLSLHDGLESSIIVIR